jgi:hypothetical protein
MGKPLRKTGQDPFGKEPSESISKKLRDAILIGDDTEASAVVHSAIEDFAQELAYVTRRFLKSKASDKTKGDRGRRRLPRPPARGAGHRAGRVHPPGGEPHDRHGAETIRTTLA